MDLPGIPGKGKPRTDWKSLEADGILTAAGKSKWRPETLKKILQNEKYIGDALLQKTYTVDFLSKKRVKNNGKDRLTVEFKSGLEVNIEV